MNAHTTSPAKENPLPEKSSISEALSGTFTVLPGQFSFETYIRTPSHSREGGKSNG